MKEKYKKIKDYLEKISDSTPENHNEYRDYKLSLPLKTVTERTSINGRIFEGTYKIDEKRENSKTYKKREKDLAIVLSYYGFDVTLINDDKKDKKAMVILGAKNIDDHPNPDATLNHIVVDFKKVDGKSPHAPGRNYHEGIKQTPSQGVILSVSNFSKSQTRNSILNHSRGNNQDGFCIIFHEDTGDLQFINVKEIRRYMDLNNKRVLNKDPSKHRTPNSYLKSKNNFTQANNNISQNEILSTETLSKAKKNILFANVSGQNIHVYEHNGYAAKICHGVKDGDKDAMLTMAENLAEKITEDCVIVPVPQHTGKAEYTLEVANMVKSIVEEKSGHKVEVQDVLECDPHKSLYEQKKELAQDGETLSDEQKKQLTVG